MPEKTRKNLLGRTVTTSEYTSDYGGLKGNKKTVTNRKGEVVRSKSKLSNGSKSSTRRGLMGRKIEKGETAEGFKTRKVTSRSGNTREVKRTTQRGDAKDIFTPDTLKKKQVLKNGALTKEKTTAFKNGKKVATDSRKFSYGKDSMTQKQTIKNRNSMTGKMSTRRYVDRMNYGSNGGSTSTTINKGPVSQALSYNKEKNK